MKRPSIPLIVTVLLVLLCPPAQAQEGTSDKTPTPEELDRLVLDKVEKNWNIVAEAVASCQERLSFDVRLAAGMVEEVVLISPESPETVKACQALADSARRAILKSSPLPVPSDMVKMTLVFDPSKIQ